MSKILFLTTAHRYDDDRIFYHQAMALQAQGFSVKICSLCSDFQGDISGVEIEAFPVLTESTAAKLKIFTETGCRFAPDVIICSEPLAVIAAGKISKHHKAEIIYDITEWYPSRRMLLPYSKVTKAFHALKFLGFQILAGWRSDRFIFGESTKKFPLAYIFPLKKQITVPYYPAHQYVKESVRELQPGSVTLCYTGRISKEDGIENFFNAVAELQNRRPDLQIRILIIGTPKKQEDQVYFDCLLEKFRFSDMIVKSTVPFIEFTDAYAKADLCFDLRENNYEYNRCLPIKLFYYIASGKPVIYTHLNAIEKHLDISGFGDLVNPEDKERIADIIERYLDNPGFYTLRARNARKAYEEQYNWELIKDGFTRFITEKLD